jgi:hypothetical protein
MRILIYLLAMLSGFSAAEAARPVSSAPASVGSAVSQSYVAAAAKVAEKTYASPDRDARFALVSLLPIFGVATLIAPTPDTPVYRHDIILG